MSIPTTVTRLGVWLTASIGLLAQATAQADLQGSASVTYADSARTAFDLAGTWNGSAEVATGDLVELQLVNAGSGTAFDLALTATLPAGFSYVRGTASGVPGISAVQAGQTLTFSLPVDTDIAAGASETIGFGLIAGASVADGTHAISLSAVYGTTDGASDGSEVSALPVVARAGASLLSVDPLQQSAAVQDSVTFDVTVENTGLGGLFDVTIDESAIDPTNGAGSLAFVSIVETAPGGSGTPGGPVLTFPYLGPGDSVTARVTATVTDCESIDNPVATTDRTAATAATVTASIALDLTQPLIAVAVGDDGLSFSEARVFTATIDNTGMGAATGLSLDSSLESLGVTVSDVDPDWSYDAPSGVFTYVANGGVLDVLESETLTFRLAPDDACGGGAGGTVIWASSYANLCGDAYGTPVVLSDVTQVAGSPSLDVGIAMGAARLDVGEGSSATVTLGWSERDLIGDDPLVVNVQMAPPFEDVTPGAPPFGTLSAVTANGFTWTVPRAALGVSGSESLAVTFTSTNDPCFGGSEVESTVSITASSVAPVSGAPCSLDDSDAGRVLITNAPTGPLNQQFNVQVPGDGVWETGAFDDGDALREDALGEGEFITYVAEYDFGAPFAGTWAGSSFKDFLAGGVDQQYVTGTAMVEVDGGAPQALTVTGPDGGETGIKIDLAQIQAIAGDANVEGHDIRITYQTVARDEILAGSASGTILELVQLEVGSAMGDGAACNMGEYNQGAYVPLARGAAVVSVAMPDTVDVCEEFDVVFAVSRANPEQPSRIVLDIPTAGSDYEIVSGQMPTYTGDFLTSTPVYAPAVGGATVTLPAGFELDAGGTVTLQMRRVATSGTAVSPISATVEYDSHQSKATAPTDFSDAGADGPVVVREAALNLTVTPQSLTVTQDTVQWRIDVTNGGAGRAYGVLLTDTLPAGLTPDATLTDAQNPIAVTVNGQAMEWSIGELAPGAGQTLTLVARVAGSTCSIPDGQNAIVATWGCGSVLGQTSSSNDPDFAFAGGALQVVHDTTTTRAVLCADAGEVTIVVRSTGASRVEDIEVSEALDTSNSGLTYVPGSSTYSVDGVVFQAITGAPTVTGAGTVTWDQANIPPLAALDPGGSGGNNTVHIRFRVDADETASVTGGAVVASVTGEEPCGAAVSSPGTAFDVPVEEPSIAVDVVGENVTTGSGQGETVIASPGDTVRWTITVTNAGDVTALNARLRGVFPGSGPTSGTLGLPGGGTMTLNDGQWLAVADAPDGGSQVYTLEYAVGASCVTGAFFTAELTWGCDAPAAGDPSGLSAPSTNADSATLEMRPDFSGDGLRQRFTALSNSRVAVEVTIDNAGGPATSLVLDGTYGGFTVDTTFTPTLTGDLTLSSLTYPSGGDETRPRFTFGGDLDPGDSAVLTFHLLPTAGFDTLFDPDVEPEFVGGGDSPRTANGTGLVTLSFDDGCSTARTETDSRTVNPAVPDLDLYVNVDEAVVDDGDTVTFEFQIQNRGESGSVAEAIAFTPTVGGGWSAVSVTVSTPGDLGTGGACAGDCTELQIGSLDRNQSAIVTITATANDNGSPLTMLGEVRGSLRRSDGSDSGSDYSLDQRRSAVLGCTLTQAITATSETFTGEGGPPRDLAVGEEVTLRVDGRWFGGSGITNLLVQSTIPAALGYVSSADAGSSMSFDTYIGATGTTAPSAGDTGPLRFELADLAGGAGTFAADLVLRALNAGTPSSSIATAPVGARFDTFGQRFASNNAQDGLSGDVELAELHAETTKRILRPELEITSLLRNETAGQMTLTTETSGDSGDVIFIETAITNNGDAPAFDLVVTEDPVSGKLAVVSGAGDGLDNDGDGTPDDGTEGAYVTGAGGSIVFDDGDGPLLERLDPGQSVVLVYRMTVDASITPNEVVTSNASVVAASLDGGAGNQTGTTGNPGDAIGAEELTGASTATFEAEMITFTKSLDATSVGADASSLLVVGEIARLRITAVLPASTIDDFEIVDQLEEGLSLVGTPAVTFGWAGPSQPTITPGVLPASGAPLDVTWDFGNLSVPDGTEAQRTITVDLLAQVANVAAAADGVDLTSSATYSFTGASGGPETIDLAVDEPEVTTQFTASPGTPTDAGAEVTYTVTLTHAGGPTAHDAGIEFDLPAGLTYVAGSTSGSVGPAIGEPTVSGTTVTWGRDDSTAPDDIDLSGGGQLAFTFRALLGDTVEPSQVLTGALATSWTSLDGESGIALGGVSAGAAGSATGERDGSGGVNDHAGSGSAPVTSANAFAVRVTASGDTVAGGGFRVGDLVTYTIEVDLQEGTADGVVIEDVLPAGLAFEDAQVISPGTGGDGFTFTQPSGANAPGAGDTGTLQWDLGTVVNAGDMDTGNDTLTLVHRARVLDAGGLSATPTTQEVVNGARLRFLDASGAPQAVGPVNDPVEIKQPDLTLSLARATGQGATVGVDEDVRLVVSATNGGDAPAYGSSFSVVLPEGMRGAPPAVVGATIDGGAAATGTVSYDPPSGTLTWTLPDGSEIDPGSTFELVLDARNEAALGAGSSLVPRATLTSWRSQGSLSATERRVYGPEGPESTTLDVVEPTDIAKAAGVAGAAIGQEFPFQLTVPGTAVAADLFDVTVLDVLDDGLTLVGVSTNAATLGATLTDGSAGQNLSYTFDRIPAGQQAVIDLTVRFDNEVGNQDTGDVVNVASYTWAGSSGGTSSGPISVTAGGVDVTEPALTVDKTFDRFILADVEDGLQAGDRIVYDMVLTNTGDAPAYDIVLDDLADEVLGSPQVTGSPDDPGAPAQVGTSAGVTTWRWTVPGPIGPGATYAFELSMLVGPAAMPQQMISNGAEVSWTSLPGVDANERTGVDGEGGPLNDYAGAEDAPVTVTVGNVVLTKTEAAAGDGTYAPGETVVYDLVLETTQGSTNGVTVVDDLPPGLAFESATFTTTNFQRAGGGAVTLLAGPTAGDTGTLTFEFGDVESTAAGPRIELELTARVLDVPGNADGTDRTNVARMDFDGAMPGDPDIVVNAQTSPVVTVVEPDLLVAIDAPGTADLGDEIDLVLRAENGGGGDAWQPAFSIQLPEGLRSVDPTAGTLVVRVTGGRDRPLVIGSEALVGYDAQTGLFTVVLAGAEGFIGHDEELIVEFRATVDGAAPDGADMDVVASATGYASADGSGGAPPGSRTYGQAVGTGTQGTPNGAAGDDATDSASIQGSVPVLSLTKAVSASVAEAGSFVTYQVTVTNAGSADLTGGTFVDDLDPNIAPDSLRNVAVTPAVGILTVESTGGANGTGRVRVEDLDLGAGQSLQVAFEVGIRRPLPDGTRVLNQASLDAPFFTASVLSDSADAADDDGVEQGNSAGDPDDDDPTALTVGARPVIELSKSAATPGGAALEPDGELVYTIVAENTGNETAVGCVLVDPVPAATTYVAGSTTLNGAPVPDVGGQSPLQGGLTYGSPGAGAGELVLDEPATITFRVRLDGNLAPGAVITNRATSRFGGVASGPQPDAVSDDPDTAEEGDATRRVVGGIASLEVLKTVSDDDGGDVAPGDTLTYTIRVQNLGGEPATGIELIDPIPGNAAYVPGSMVLDPDGAGPDPAAALTDADDGDGADFGVTTAGALRLARSELAAGSALTLTFRVLVDGGAAPGTLVSNQAVVSYGEGPDEPSDADGDDGDGDQPTAVVVGNVPALRMTKEVMDLNGGVALPGDGLRYLIAVENIGAADATSVVVSDPMPPAGTAYVPGTTRLGAAALADDPGDLSPLVAGVDVGTLAAGQRVTIEVDVEILAGEPAGTILSNQASFTSANAGSGVSDSSVRGATEGGNDPSDPADDDETVLTVGGSAGSASVSGRVWRDNDHDRAYTPPGSGLPGTGANGATNDAPVEGWSVVVSRGGITAASTTTAADGTWRLAGIQPGAGYEIRFLHPVTGITFGNPLSSAPGVQTTAGLIEGLDLDPGANVLDQDLPLDPSGVVYNAVTRQPVAGAVATLSGPPGFDPVIHLPAGQQGQTTAADGFYRFDLLAGFPAGVYRLDVVPPVGYLPTFPSAILPPAGAALDPTGNPDPFLVVPNNGAPAVTDSTLYHVEFDLAPGDPNVLNNHVAIDPILEGAIALTKTTPKQNVVRGELVPYTLAVLNTLSVPLPPSEVIDTLPPGFKYVAGSATVDGVPAEPTVNGRVLTWAGIDFAPGQSREVVLVAVIGAGVGDGRYVNTAMAREPFSQESLSNVASAEVFVVPDPVFDCSDVLGKVFDDRNGDGIQTAGEPGIAGVRLVTARGLVVTTDAFGRYHIACPELSHDMRGSNFILKIDERSLPTGFRVTTENPRVVRLTRGKFVEADFGAAASRVMRVEFSDRAFVAADEADGRRVALDEGWNDVLRLAFAEIEGGPAVLRLGYVATDEPEALVKERTRELIRLAGALWEETERGPLRIEREVLRTPRASRPGTVDADGVPVNAEQPDVAARDIPGAATLSIDGVVKGVRDGAPAANAQARADRALARANVRLQADGFDVTPRLNVTAVRASVPESGTATFSVYANYWSWIESAEVRVFPPDSAGDGEPLAVVSLGVDGATGVPVASIEAAEIGEAGNYVYVARVTDARGRHDETRPQVLRIIPDEAFEVDERAPASALLAGFGESRLERRGIPVKGGAVTVSGKDVPAGGLVRVLGQGVPVDPDGTFVTQVILGEGQHSVDVTIEAPGGEALVASRDVHFPKDDWFFVGLADLTVGGNSSSGDAALVTGDDQLEDSVYVNGRVAFYAKGKIKGEHLLTMSFDSGDRPLDEILSGLDERDPRTLMRFVDPDRFYPVYGDDSTTTWDAPTQGRFYVRLERDDYRVLWGNFKTQILDTELAQIDRGLYGFQGHWHSRAQTQEGEQRTELDVYAASPDSAGAREELRGTGGSLYYLRHRELVLGSERVRVEVRDKDSGVVLSVRNLAPQQDYEVDYLAGRLLLTQPLPSTAGDGFAVQNSSLAGNPVYLVARYEFVPRGTDLEALAVGGRVSHWVSDAVQVGATADRRQQTGGDRDLAAVDVTWRRSAGTYIKAEVARTEGPGGQELTSLDGGFQFGQPGGALAEGADGIAARVEGAVDLSEFESIGLRGRLTGVVQTREGGFAGAGLATAGDSTQVNLAYLEPLSERSSLRVEVDVRDEQIRSGTRAVDAQYTRTFGDDEQWSASVGLRHDDVDAGNLASAGGARDGRRSDMALRLGYDGWESGEVWVFGQLTLDRSRSRTANNRIGLGSKWAVTDDLSVSAEVSGGAGGLGATAGTEWAVTDRTDLYLAYGLDADRSDTGLGARNGRRTGVLTAGAKHRYSDAINVFAENRYSHGAGPVGLTHVYGTDYSPSERWTFGVLMENGQLEEAGQRQIERTGVSVNAGYVREKVRAAAAVEWREDEATGAPTRDTWLTRNTLAYQASEDWRLLANLDLARSDGGAGAASGADFTELGFGWAHRPVEHERWNALLRYTYQEDLPSPGQVDAFGGLTNFAQRSHVLSADANYDLTERLTVGGKIGLRHGELRATRGAGGEWFDSQALLYALRADVHVVSRWDALIEARLLDVDAAEDRRAGVLASIWRHIGDSGKLGVGYSFADFTDDLTDMDYDAQGWFINLVGKF